MNWWRWDLSSGFMCAACPLVFIELGMCLFSNVDDVLFKSVLCVSRKMCCSLTHDEDFNSCVKKKASVSASPALRVQAGAGTKFSFRRQATLLVNRHFTSVPDWKTLLMYSPLLATFPYMHIFILAGSQSTWIEPSHKRRTGQLHRPRLRTCDLLLENALVWFTVTSMAMALF